MASNSFKTINGINGININKVLLFAFGKKSIKYSYDDDEKTFVYLMDKKLFEGEGCERNRQVRDHFVKFWCVIIKEV